MYDKRVYGECMLWVYGEYMCEFCVHGETVSVFLCVCRVSGECAYVWQVCMWKRELYVVCVFLCVRGACVWFVFMACMCVYLCV